MSDGSREEAGISMEDTAPSRDERERNQVIDDQLNRIDSRLQGNSLLVHGSRWTAEAREPDRRHKLLEQLSLARKLRAKIEHAADRAEQFLTQGQARKLLLQHTDDISTLACLTEAVKGNYVLDSYDYYSRKAQQENEAKKERAERARAILDEHLESTAREENETEETNVATRPVTVATASSAPTKPPPKKKKPRAKKAYSRIRAKAPSPSRPRPRAPRHALFTTFQSSRPTAASPDSPDTELSQEKLPKRVGKTKRRRDTRQCHDCKSSTTYYQRCTYWQADGTQCGKVFCRKCIEGKYEVPRDDWESTAQQDWHCPSCIGNCLCRQCEVKRKAAAFPNK